jgi:hypothetical protein
MPVGCKKKKNTVPENNQMDTVITEVVTDTVPMKTLFVNHPVYYYEKVSQIKGIIALSDQSAGDDKVYMLLLDTPVTILPYEEKQDVEDPNKKYTGITKIHLLFPDPGETVNITNKPVIVKGFFWGAYSGSHYTPVIMDVVSVRPE